MDHDYNDTLTIGSSGNQFNIVIWEVDYTEILSDFTLHQNQTRTNLNEIVSQMRECTEQFTPIAEEYRRMEVICNQIDLPASQVAASPDDLADNIPLSSTPMSSTIDISMIEIEPDMSSTTPISLALAQMEGQALSISALRPLAVFSAGAVAGLLREYVTELNRIKTEYEWMKQLCERMNEEPITSVEDTPEALMGELTTTSNDSVPPSITPNRPS